jgi:MFS family permease
MPQTGFYGWTLLGAFWAIVFINLAFASYGSPVMNAAMAVDMHLTRAFAGTLFGIYTVMSGAPALLTAVLVRHIGVRRTVVLGSLLVMLGALGMATVVHNATGAVVAFGVVVGLGVATGGVFGVQPGVVQWFVRRRALALAIIYAAGGVGGFVAPRILSPLVTAWHSWRAGWWLFAGLACCAGIVAAVFIRERPADLGQLPDGGPGSAALAGPAGTAVAPAPRQPFITQEVWSFADLVMSGRFWILVLALCGGSAGFTLFLSQGLLHLADLGHTSAAAASALSITTSSTLLGKVALGAFGDRIDPRYIFALALLVFGVGLVLVVHARGNAIMYAFAVCIGFGFGGGLVCMMAVLSNYYGTRVFPAAAGLAAALNTGVSAIAAPIGGRIFDQTGSYAPTFYSLALWCFVGAVALLLVRRPHLGTHAATPAVAAGGS